MKKILSAAMLMLGLFAGCGGGGGDGAREYAVGATYPEKLAPYAADLNARGVVAGGGGAILSVPSDGRLEDGAWRFTIDPLGDIPESGAHLHVEFLRAGLVLASVDVPIVQGEAGILPDEAAALYDFSADDDSDGLPNIDELINGTDPKNPDTDGDSHQDGGDSFPLDASEWADADGDGIGDNAEKKMPDETTASSVAAADLDADDDGIEDADDDCPGASNPYQDDRDADGSGDECDPDIDGDGIPNAIDNCAYVANPLQLAADADGDGVSAECDLDDSDPGVIDDANAVFVDIAHGLDLARGSRTAALASMARAVALAASKNAPVYVAAGEYDVSDLSLPAGARIFGGFANSSDPAKRFASRDVRSSAPEYRTVIYRSDAPVTLLIAADRIVVDGFHIENRATSFDAVKPSSSVYAAGGSAALERNSISGNVSSPRSAGVRIMGGTIDLARNWIDGGGRDGIGSSSAGIEIAGGELAATNNIVIAGNGRFAAGISIADASPVIVNNTIDARSGNPSLGESIGAEFEDASPRLINNILITGNAPDQYALKCTGDEPGAGASFGYNIFARFPAEDGTPIIRDCDGIGYTGGAFKMGAAAVGANAVFAGAGVNALVDAEYRPVGAGGRSDALDDGADASAKEYGAVKADFDGVPRPRGNAYDVGAIER